MSEHNKHIDDLFNDALGDYTETPPPAVWDALEQRLDDDSNPTSGGATGGGGRPVFPYRWLWYVGALLLLVAATVTVWSVTKNSKPVEKEEVHDTVGDDNNIYNRDVDDNAQPINDNDSSADEVDQNVEDNSDDNNAQTTGDKAGNTSTNKDHNTKDKTPSAKDKSQSTTNKTSNLNDYKAQNLNNKTQTSTNKTQGSNNKTQTTVDNNSPNAKTQAAKVASADNKNNNTTAPVDKPKADDNTASNGANKQVKVADGKNQNANAKTQVDEKSTAPVTKPKTQDTKPKTQNTDTKTQDTNPKTQNTDTKTQSAKPKTQNTDTKTQATNPKTQNTDTKTQDTKPKTQNTDTPPADDKVAKNKTNKPKTADKKQDVDDKPTDAKDPKDKVTKDNTDKTVTPKTDDKKQDTDTKAADKKVADDKPSTTPVAPKTKNKTAKPADNKQQVPQAKPDAKDNDAADKDNANKALNRDYLKVPPVEEEEEEELDLDKQAFNNGGDLTPGGNYKDWQKNNKHKRDKQKNQNNAASKFGLGMTLGYEYGFDNNFKANKIVIAPYVQYNVTSKFSLLFQPAYLMGFIKADDLSGANELYYNQVSASADSVSVINEVDTTLFPQPPYIDTINTTYRYKRTYDSTVVSQQFSQKRLWEAELPLILQYKVSDNFSVFGGVSLTVSKVLRVEEVRRDFTGLTDSLQTTNSQTYPRGTSAPPPPPTQDPNSVFGAYTGKPIGNYQPMTSTTANTFTRFGYSVGFNATVRERILLGLSLQQKFVNSTQIPNESLRKIYSQPYVRMTVGYKIFK